MAIKGLLFDLFGVLLVKDKATGAWLVNQELVAWVRALKAQGGYRIGLVSNTSYPTVKRFMNQASLDADFFDARVLSGEEDFAKPDPRFFQLALQRLAVEAENSLLIDDSKDNILVAQALGLAVIWADQSAEIVPSIEDKLKER